MYDGLDIRPVAKACRHLLIAGDSQHTLLVPKPLVPSVHHARSWLGRSRTGDCIAACRANGIVVGHSESLRYIIQAVSLPQPHSEPPSLTLNHCHPLFTATQPHSLPPTLNHCHPLSITATHSQLLPPSLTLKLPLPNLNHTLPPQPLSTML